MRWQAWDGHGNLIRDEQVIRAGGIPTFVDHVHQTQRPATEDERRALEDREAEEAKLAAKERFTKDAQANRNNGPLGQMLYDLAVSLGWIAPG